MIEQNITSSAFKENKGKNVFLQLSYSVILSLLNTNNKINKQKQGHFFNMEKIQTPNFKHFI